MEELQTVMIKKDYKGDVYNATDCPGCRAFKRAYKKIVWYKRLFFWSYYWISDRGGYDTETWESYKDNCEINMMYDTRIGDLITFRKI